MHLMVLGYCCAALVASILLYVLARKLLNKGRAIAPINVEDRNHGTPAPSIPPIESHYDVFLSFRGTDSRRGFTDHLYSSLMDAGIHVFRDDDELRVGESIGPSLLEAIEKSKILIPIISENYASSKWCLNELVHMMECKKRLGHIVLPVFYKVKPAEVRYQKGSFGEAFHYYGRKRFDPEVVDEWKKALAEVSFLQGFVADGYEGELVKLIVRKVLNQLKEAMNFNLVGIDSHVKKVMELVNKSPGATLYVGIYGMAGIGKTTLAKVIYNKLSNLFEHRSFIADIRELCKRNGIEHLQNQLISDILRIDIHLCNKDEGIHFISSRFKYKKVLILLDDVDETYQLEGLAGNHNWFAPGSRIVVTTRDQSVLDRTGALKYEHEGMDKEQSLILFSRHAFRMDYPPREFVTLSRHVVSMTQGLPLALEVVGSLLYGKGQEAWVDTIEKMQISPHLAVQDKLMMSYEVLKRDQKQIFLDIACFLIGSDARVASYMWDACGFYTRVGIEELSCLSFINIGDNHELMMHDQLRDLGREIVREENQQEPQYRSRLWIYEEALEVLEGKKGTEMIQAICLEKGNSTRIADEFTDEQFRNLPSLRFLHMSDVNLIKDFSEEFSQLIWLKWWNCPPTFAAKNFHARKLVILDLSGSLILDDLRGWSSIMMAEKLKVLNLTGCRSLKSTFYLSAFKSLEILILKDCGELEQIDPSIGDMQTLVYLNLSGCLRLEELPPQMGKLEQLEELHLDQTMIPEIPSSIGSLKKLGTLSAKDCKFLVKLPHSIGHLESLRCLSLRHCHQLSIIPDTVGMLKSLTQLDLSGTMITELPESIGVLEKLVVLDIEHSRIEKLPDGIVRLKKLRELNV